MKNLITEETRKKLQKRAGITEMNSEQGNQNYVINPSGEAFDYKLNEPAVREYIKSQTYFDDVHGRFQPDDKLVDDMIYNELNG